MLVNCKYCNLELDHKRLPRHEKACRLNPVNSIAAVLDPVELTKENIALIENLPKQLKRNRSICYTCRSCQQKVIINSYLKFRSFDTCPQCDRVKTCIQRYGGKAPACSQEVSNRIIATRKLSGEEGLKKSNEKRKKTCLQKYGVEAVSQNKGIREKQLKTWHGKSSEEKLAIQKKRQVTMFNRYGKRHALQVLELKKKARENYEQTCQIKYGMQHAPKSSYTYQNETFDSSWELAVWIWAKENSVNIKRLPVSFSYDFNGKVHTYYPDFEIEGKLVEIKGDLFFNAEGKMLNPFLTTDDGLFEAKHQCGLKNGVEFWTSKELQPVLDYVYSKYTQDFLYLFKNNLPFPYPEFKKDDLSLIRYFHKSIYEARKKNYLSPVEAWQNKDLILKSALNRLQYVRNCKPESILAGFNVAKIAPKVSVFKPSKAVELINKYLKNCDLIVDPFSGFSGRMLGALKCGKAYRGSDINGKHVKESNEIIRYLNTSVATVVVEDIIKAPARMFNDTTALFTCPPYEDKEFWDKNYKEAIKTCDEWIDLCLDKYQNCKNYLFVVDTTEKYKNNVVEEIVNKSHFGKNIEKVILIKN